MDLDFLLDALKLSNLDRVEYQYFDQLLNHNTIILNDAVDEDIIEGVIIPLRKMAADPKVDKVTLFLNTPGGQVSNGLPLCNIIDTYPKKLDIIVYGYACSMGAIILCAGNKNSNVTKYCYPFSYALLHAGEVFLVGEANIVKDTRNFFENIIEKKVEDYIISNTNISREEYAQHSRVQWYMTAEEMQKYGLIDYIIGVDSIDES